jgi:hypothetical protein
MSAIDTPFVIAIPSYKRCSTIISKTIPLLLSHNFPPNDIHVFVVEEQLQQYTSAIAPLSQDIKVIVGRPTLSAQRNFIIDYFPIGTPLLMVDDDIADIGQKVADKIVSVQNLYSIVSKFFKTCSENNVDLWGIYPVWNARFMTDASTRGLNYILGSFYGLFNHQRFKCDYEHGEDYARSLKEFYDNPNGTIRFNQFSAKSRGFTGKGGMNSPEFNRIANVLPSLVRLQQEYPNNVIIKMKKTPIEVYNVRLVGRKIYQLYSTDGSPVWASYKDNSTGNCNLCDCNSIILHLDKATERKEKVNKLRNLCKYSLIWKARDIDTITDDEKKLYSDLRFFHRIPSKYTPERSIIGHCNFAIQYIGILKFIVENKIDNVIVFEDDAELINPKQTSFPCNSQTFISLGGWFFDKKRHKYAGSEAIYYPKWTYIRDLILPYFTNPKNFRQLDYMLFNWLPKKTDATWTIQKLFYQRGMSIIDNKELEQYKYGLEQQER